VNLSHFCLYFAKLSRKDCDEEQKKEKGRSR
jgi:hypothetical protein